MKKLKDAIYYILLTHLFCYHFFPYNQIEEEIKPTLSSFRVKMWDKCNKNEINSTWQMSIQIKDEITWFNKEVVGICHPRLLGFDITFRKDFWEASNNINKKQLLYHELLHCYLNIDHEPGTIMDAYTLSFSEEETERQLDYFLDKVCKK